MYRVFSMFLNTLFFLKMLSLTINVKTSSKIATQYSHTVVKNLAATPFVKNNSQTFKGINPVTYVPGFIPL